MSLLIGYLNLRSQFFKCCQMFTFFSSLVDPKSARKLTETETTESQSTTNMHVSNNNSVFLQTTRAFVRVAGDAATEQNVRLIADSGSRKSYVTADLKRALNLPVFCQGEIDD